MEYKGIKFQVTTQVGKKKFVRIFKNSSTVDKYITEARRLKTKYPNSAHTKITLKVII